MQGIEVGRWRSPAFARGRGMTGREQEVLEIRTKFAALRPLMSESVRRRWAAAEALARGHGGISLLSEATGLSRPTIRRGLAELRTKAPVSIDRIRKPGGGRKPARDRDQQLIPTLWQLLASSRSAPLLLSSWSLSALLHKLRLCGHRLSLPTLRKLLAELGFRQSKRENQRQKEPSLQRHASYVLARTEQFLRCGQPVLLMQIPSGSLGAALLSPIVRSFFATHADRTESKELLLLVSFPRSMSTAPDLSTDCTRLSWELQRPVQVLLLPSGIYRVSKPTIHQQIQMVEEPNSHRSRHSFVELVQVGATRMIPRALAAQTYAAYRHGLIDVADGQDLSGAFGFCCVPRIAAERLISP